MGCTLVLGATFGDEGKAKIVDYIAKDSDVVCRFSGGSNCGHTIVVDGKKYINRLLPSGYMYPKTQLVISQGVLLDIEVLMEEVKSCPADIKSRLIISAKAHLVFPYHKAIDYSNNIERPNDNTGRCVIGTTGKGIGPCVADKVNRIGFMVADLFDLWKFRKALLVREIEERARTQFDFEEADENWVRKQVDAKMDIYEEFIDTFKDNIEDTSFILNNFLEDGKNVLLEGAQGTLLDLDHGTYPFVTSTNCVSGAASVYTGIPPKKIDRIIGVFKAYTTRVGNGPFPTEFEGPIADKIREVGHEFGSVTKRPRRIGWLDLPALKFSCMINGFDELVMTKYDVLQDLKEVKFASEYWEGSTCHFTANPSMSTPKIHYESFGTANNTCENYIATIQRKLKTPITMYSDGADREAIHHVKQ